MSQYLSDDEVFGSSKPAATYLSDDEVFGVAAVAPAREAGGRTTMVGDPRRLDRADRIAEMDDLAGPSGFVDAADMATRQRTNPGARGIPLALESRTAPLPEPTADAAKNRSTMQRSASPESVMFTPGRTLDRAEQQVARGKNIETKLKAAGFDSIDEFKRQQEVSQGRVAFAEANPKIAAMASGSAKAMAGTMNIPSVAAGFLNEIAINPILKAAGAEPLARPPTGPGTGWLERAAGEYMPEIAKLSVPDAWNKGVFASWLGANVAAQMPQVAQSVYGVMNPAAVPVILPMMGATAAGSSFAEGDDPRVAVTKGVVEMLSEGASFGVAAKVKDAIQAMSPAAQKTLFRTIAMRSAAVGGALTAQSLAGAIEETVAQLGNNALDIYASGKNKSMLEDVDKSAVIGAATNALMSMPNVADAARDNTAKGRAARELSGALSGTLPSVDLRPRTNPNLANVLKVENQPTVPVAPTGPVPPAAARSRPPAPAADEKTDAVNAIERILANKNPARAPAAAPTGAPDVGNTLANDALDPGGVPGGSADAAGGQLPGGLLAGGAGGPVQPTAAQPASSGRADGPVGDAGGQPAPVATLNDSGTLTIKGEPAAIIDMLRAGGVVSILPASNGVVVGKNQAEQALSLVNQNVQNTAQTSVPAPAAAAASPAPKPLTRAAAIESGPAVVLQNRDRSSAASITQMNEIASSPDYLRAGPARVMETGAPVTFGDIPETAVVGRTEQIADGKGERVTVQYAVAEAADVIASNSADGSAIPQYADGEPGKMRAVAGNGRAAGIAEAYRRGTASQYRADLEADAQALGLDPAAIQNMRAPMLVRVMNAKDVTPDIGDRSNIAGTAKLSAVEQAGTDARRIDLAALEFAEDGEPTPEAVRQFTAGMPTAERGELINRDGSPTRQAIDRLMAATFKQAYGSDELVRLYAQATDAEARTIMSALADAAGAMASLQDTGELDIRGAVAEAAGIAVNARRKGQKLADVLQNADMTMSGEAFEIARFFADNIRSAKRISEGLRNWANQAAEQARIARDNEVQGGMFGETPVMSREQLFGRLGNGQQETPQERPEQPRGQGDAGERVARRQDDPAAAEAGAAAGDQAEGLSDGPPNSAKVGAGRGSVQREGDRTQREDRAAADNAEGDGRGVSPGRAAPLQAAQASTPEELATARADLAALRKERILTRASAREDIDARIARLEAAIAEREGLTAPTQQEVIEQQDRASNATALDEKEQIDRESSGQTLTSQTAPEQRTDTSSDMFAREKAEAEIAKRNAGKPKDDNGTAPMFEDRTGPDVQRELEPWEVALAPSLATALRRWQKGRVGDKTLAAAVRAELDERKAKRDNAKTADRVRGADWIRERLLRARRTGELSEAQVDLAMWMLDQAPQMATDLGISIREGGVGTPNGLYNSAERVVTIFADKANDETATHEILHHTERMMPPDVQAGIRREWLRQLERGVAKAKKTIEARRAAPAEKPGWTSVDTLPDADMDQKRLELLDMMLMAARNGDADITGILWKKGTGDGANLQALLPYELSQPSEFWAVNGAALMREKAEADGDWVAKAKLWLKGLIERAKELLRLPSDAPVLRGLRAVMEGDGSRRSGMISRQGATFEDRAEDDNGTAPMFSRAGPPNSAAFKAWFGNSLATVNGKAGGTPLVVYHGAPDARFMNDDGTFKTLTEKYGGESPDGGAHWFAADRAVAQTYAKDTRAFDYQNAEPAVVPAYLKLENPLIVDGGGKHWREAQRVGKTSDVIEKAKAEGHDGVIIRNVKDDYNNENGGKRATDTYVVWRSTQIKSATNNNGEYDPANPDIRMKRGTEPGGLTPADAQRAVDAFKNAGLRKLFLAETIEDLPESGRRKIKSEGITGVRGMYDPATDTTYLVRSNLASLDEAFFVGMHEAFHRGLRKTFGAEVQPILELIHDSNERVRTMTAAYMKEYGIGRTEAIEEVLADMAGQGQAGDLKGWDKLLAFLRGALAKIAKAMGVKIELTDAQITDLVAGVRKAGMQDEVHLESTAPQTETAAFRKWFGDSKVVDADGKPLVVYHGTKADFTEFKSTRGGEFGPAIYLTDSAREAGEYGDGKGWGGPSGTSIMPVYASIQNPYTKGVDAFWKEFGTGGTDAEGVRAAQAAGYDGIIAKRADRYYDNDAREFVDRGDELTHYIAFQPSQIKSAIGNRGTFDGGNDDIRFSRNKPRPNTPAAGSPTVSKAVADLIPGLGLDETGRIQLEVGAKLRDFLAEKTAPWWERLGMKGASPELRRQLRAMKIAVAEAQETAVAVAKESQKLSAAEREMTSDIIEQELATGVLPPAHAVHLAQIISSTMETQTDELVRLGMLTKDSADKWRGKYLPRFYKSKLLGNVTDAWSDAMQGLRGKTSAMKGIKGKHLKGRGLYETIPESQLADFEALGWELRDDGYTPTIDGSGTVQVWRDFTRAERDQMGEIRDVGFRFVMGYMQTQKDIALGQMFEGMAGDPDISSRTATEDMQVQVPDTTVPGTGAKRYGMLAGRYVAKATMDHLSQIEEAQSDALRLYREALGIWKEGKTVLNLVSHMNNIVSNLTMAHLAGVSYHRGDKYMAAVLDFAKGSPKVQEAKEAGLFLGTVSDVELMNTLPKELRDLAIKQESYGRKAGRTAFNVLSFGLRRIMGAAYQGEDLFFRYLIWKDATERGMDAGDAVDYAQKFIFNYDDLPATARKIRDFGIPFFSYTYKFIPAALSTAMTHPWRMAAPAAVLWTAQAAMYAMLASDDDDDWMDVLKRYMADAGLRDKAAKQQKDEAKNLPPWMQGRTALGTPRAMRMGTDAETGMPLFIDVSRMVPGGDIFDVSPNAGGVPFFQWMTPSHPIFTTAVAMFGNKDMFYGKEITDSNDTREEATKKRLAWLWKQASPAIAVNNYHWERGMNALAQANGGELPEWVPDMIGGDSTGVGRDRLPVQPKYAAMQTIGIKIRPMDLDKAEDMNEGQKAKLLREIDRELNVLRRMNRDGVLSDRGFEKERERADVKKDRLRDGKTVDGDEKP